MIITDPRAWLAEVQDKVSASLWESVDDKGIKGRLFREDCDYLARAAIAAYLGHTEVTTVEELDALPVGTIIHDAHEDAFQSDADYDEHWWTTVGDEEGYASEDITLPARVLHRGNS